MTPLEPDNVPACERILRALPEWFGIESANRACVRALVEAAEDWCTRRGVRWLNVKTRAPSAEDRDPSYARTRAIYLAAGFEPLFETVELWGPEDPALILVKRLA